MTWSFKLPLVSWRDCKEVDEDLEMELVEVESSQSWKESSDFELFSVSELMFSSG